ncbi:Hypothetical protein SMAX5B_015440 [Scophthalmus maximus]|nr:Hypothetical protein SMAX5B_015440 [Scophthalmus maximus]
MPWKKKSNREAFSLREPPGAFKQLRRSHVNRFPPENRYGLRPQQGTEERSSSHMQKTPEAATHSDN